MENKKDIAVSVYCMTYNHVDIISKAIDGFVMQKTNFPFEVWVHDDCSTDGTIDVLKEYESKYPDLIHVVYEEENMYSKGYGIFALMKPYIVGKYHAMCEGDDYWTDPYKLQKQYDFMEENPDVALCVHASTELNLTTGNSFKRPAGMSSQYLDMSKIIECGGGFFPTNTFFAKNTYDVGIKRWGNGICGDFNRILLAGLNGKVYYMDEIMSVKTAGYSGSWSSRHSDVDIMCQHVENEITSLELFNKDTDYKYDEAVKNKIKLYRYQIDCEYRGNVKLLFTDPYYKDAYQLLPKAKKIRSFLLAYMKPVYSLYSILNKVLIKIKSKIKKVN